MLAVLSQTPDSGPLPFPIFQWQHSLCSIPGLPPVCCGLVKEAESSYCNYLRFWAVFCASNPVTRNRRKPLCPKPSYLLSPTQRFLGKGDCSNLGKGSAAILSWVLELWDAASTLGPQQGCPRRTETLTRKASPAVQRHRRDQTSPSNPGSTASPRSLGQILAICTPYPFHLEHGCSKNYGCFVRVLWSLGGRVHEKSLAQPLAHSNSSRNVKCWASFPSPSES